MGKHILVFKKASIIVYVCTLFTLLSTSVTGQVLISQEGFNNSVSAVTVSGGVYYSGITGGGVKPPGAPKFSEGAASYGIKNGTAVITSNVINTGNFGNNTVSFRLAALGNGMGNGVDNVDYVRVEISTNGGTSYTQHMVIYGNPAASYWDFLAAGVATVNYPNSVSIVAPNGNVSSTTYAGLNTGYGTVIINDIPTTTNLRVRITLFNDKNQKDWMVDDLRVTGYNLPQVSSFTGNTFCTGTSSGSLSMVTNSGTGPFTVVYSDGISNYTATNVQSGMPFATAINPVSTTNYSIISVTDANNATRTSGFTDGSATVTINTLPVVSAGSPFTKSCVQNIAGAQIGEIHEPGFSYSWSPSTGLNDPLISNPVANPSETTTYTVTKTNNSSGCFSSASVTVTVNTVVPIVSSGSPFSKTCILNPGGSQIGESNDISASYSWSPDAGLSNSSISNPVANPVVTTNYSITKTFLDNGCSASASVLVTVDIENPFADAGDDQVITCNLNSTGVNIGTPSLANRQYDWSPVSGLDNSTISQPYAFPAITTIYTLNVINTVNGCQSSDDVTVSVNNSTPSVNAGTPFTISCISNPTGGSIGEVSEPGYIYSWSPSEGLSDPAISSPFANPSTTTIYTVIKTNLTTGCAVSANITVTVDNQQPVASLLNNTGISELTCAVQSISVSASGGLSYTWDGGAAGSSDSERIFTSPGTYTVTVTAANGCSDTESILITQDITPPSGAIINNSATTEITCAQPSITVTATGGVSYSWDGGAAGSSDAERIFITPGTYTVTITAANGCTDSKSITITQSVEFPVAVINNQTGSTELNCVVSTIHVFASGGISYSWDGGTAGSSDAERIFVAPGTYTVTVTAANGCVDTESIVITQDIASPVSIITNNTGTTELTCNVLSVNVTASGGVSYSWDGGVAGSSPSDRIFTLPGTYTVTVSATNGCTDTESIVITQDIITPVAIISNSTGTNELTCSVTSIVAEAGGGISYTWDGGIAGSSAAERIFTSPGNYTVTVTSANGCSDTESILITQDVDVPVANITNNTGTFQITCSVTSIIVTASGGVSYSWVGGSQGSTDAERIFTSPGIYSVTVSNANGCSDIENITITQDITLPTVSVANSTGTTELTCSVPSILVTAGGGESYLWDGGSAGSSAAERIFTFPGTYTVTVTGSNGCTDAESIIITQDIISPVAIISNNTGTTQLTCDFSSISVSASGGVNYSWDGGSTGSSDAERIFTSPGTYTVTVTGSNGCLDTESIIITQDISSPVAMITNNSGTTELTCSTPSISVIASGGVNYEWDGGMAGSSSAERIFTTPGTYTVTVTSANGCTDTEIIVITQDIITPVAIISNSTGATELTCILTSITVIADGGISFAWDGGIAGSSAAERIFTLPGTYTVTVTSANGCTDTESIIITQDISSPGASITNNSGTTELTCLVASINVAATGGLFYAWDGGSAGSTDAERIFTVPGSYTVTVTAQNGCTDTESIIITQDITSPVASITNNTGTEELTCIVSSITAIANGGVSYTWDGGIAGSSDAERIFTSPGTYTVTVTAANGCTDTESITITQDINVPVAVIANNTGTTELSCSITSINVMASGGDLYTWDGGIAGSSDAERIFTSPGTYTVTVSDMNGCSDQESIIITQDINVPVAVITNNTGNTELSCTTNSINVNASGGVLYAWDGGIPGLSDAQRIFTSPGIYTVTVTSSNGCTDTENIIITQDINVPTAVITNNTGTSVLTCTTTSILVNASGGVSYTWDGGTAGSMISERYFTQPGTYTLVVTGGNGCSDTASIIITQDISTPAAGIINITGTTELNCSTSTIVVLATGEGTYSWSGGSAGNNQDEWMFTEPGLYTLSVIAPNGCFDEETILITENIISPLAPFASMIQPDCDTPTGQITITNPLQPGYNYGIDGVYQTSNVFNGLTPGQYNLTVQADNGCISTPVLVTINEQPVIPGAPIITVADNCDGTSTILATNVSGIVTWSNGSNANPLYVITAGNYYAIQTLGPCSSTQSNLVFAQPKYTPPAPGVTVLNNINGTTTLTATGFTGSLLWSTGETTTSITVSVNGVYSVTQQVNGCTSEPGFGATSLQMFADPALGEIQVVNASDVLQNAMNLLFGNIYKVQVPVYNMNQINMVPAGSTTLKINLGSKFILDPGFNLSNANLDNYFTWSSSVISGDLIITGSQYADLPPDFTGLLSFNVLGSSACSENISIQWLIDNHSSTVLFSDEDMANNQTGLIYNLPVTVSVTATHVSCFGANNGSISTVASPGTIVVITNALNQIVTNPLPPGTYKVTATGSNSIISGGGCSSFTMVTIQQPVAPVSLSVSGTNVSCFGFNNGSTSVVASGGTEPYSYQWNSLPMQFSSTATGLTAGTYTVLVTDSAGCLAVASYSVLQPLPMVSSSSVNKVSCYNGTNGSITISTSGGTAPYTYNWQGFPGNNTSSLTGLVAGNYTVTITDSKGCSNIISVNVSQPASEVSAITTGSNVSCFGGNNGTASVIPSGGTPGYTYLWNSVPASTVANVSGLAYGTYSVIVTDANGCSATAFYNVSQPSAPLEVIPSVTNLTCNGSGDGSISLNVVGGTGPYTYSWSTTPVQNTPVISGLSAGNYFVTVTDVNGCSISSLVTVTQPSAINTTGSVTNISCSNLTNGSATVIASGGTGMYTYQWNTLPVQTTATATGLSAGTWSVLVTDGAGCQKMAYFTITSPLVLALDLNISNVTCFGSSNGTASAVASGGSGPYSYSWNTIPVQNTAAISGLSAGIYSVTITDSKGCSVVEAFNVTEPFPLTAIAGGTDVSCNGGNNGSAYVNITGGTEPYNYQWNTIPVQSNSNAVNLSQGNYSVLVTDANGCVLSTSIIVSEPASPLSVIMSGSPSSCNSGNNGTAAVTVSGGTAPYSYQWNTIPVQTSAVATGLNAGSYAVTVSDANGCSVTGTYVVTQPASGISVSLDITHVACYGNSTGIVSSNITGGTAPYTYQWNNNPLLNTPSLVNVTSGIYSLIVIDANGCSSYIEGNVSQPASPLQAQVINVQNNICHGGSNGSISVNVNGGTLPYSYQWNTIPVQTSATASGLSSGNYSVNVSDGNGCTVTTGATITQPSGTLPDLSLGSDYSSNFFPAMNSENTIVYNISEIGGNPATGDTLRIILPSGYQVLFDQNETSVNVGSNNYNLDNSRWKLLQTNSAFVSIILDPLGNSSPGTLNCSESVRISVKLKRVSSARSIFTLSARLRRADAELNLSNNLNSIVFLAE